RGFRIAREVPLDEAFGVNTPELVRLLNEVPHYPWLAPSTLPPRDRIAQLVEEHYRSLNAFAPVEFKPPHLIQSWEQALRIELEPRGGEPAHASALSTLEENAWDRICAVGASRAAAFAVRHVAYLGAWEAGWRHARQAVLRAEQDVVRVEQQLTRVWAEYLRL